MKTDLSPAYALKELNKFIDELTVFPGVNAKQIKTNTGSIENIYFNEANQNSTQLMKIYLRSELCTKKII
jgi:hypothetical protein